MRSPWGSTVQPLNCEGHPLDLELLGLQLGGFHENISGMVGFFQVLTSFKRHFRVQLVSWRDLRHLGDNDHQQEPNNGTTNQQGLLELAEECTVD